MPTITTIDPPPGAKRPRRHRLTGPEKLLVALAALLVLACIGAILFVTVLMPRFDAADAFGGPFRLTASDGRTVTDESFRGKYMLIYFGYTYCPDVCPTTLADMGVALKTLGARADMIQPLFITVDPARDTPDVLKTYTAAFAPRLLGLTGSQDEITTVEKEYRVVAQTEKTGKGPGDYVIDHASLFYLMGPDGRFVAVLPADRRGDALAADIASHLPSP